MDSMAPSAPADTALATVFNVLPPALFCKHCALFQLFVAS